MALGARVIKKHLTNLNQPTGASGLVGCFVCTDNASVIDDLSGGSRDLTKTGTLSYPTDATTGLVGAQFSGTQYLQRSAADWRFACIDGATTGAAHTIEVLAKVGTSTGIMMECAAVGESLATNYLWRLYPNSATDGSNFQTFRERDTGTNCTGSTYTGMARQNNNVTYYAVTCASNGTDHRAYVNGVHVFTSSGWERAEKHATTNSQFTRIGQAIDGATTYTGVIYSFRFWNTTLSATQITEAYNRLLSNPTEVDQNLVAARQPGQLWTGFKMNADQTLMVPTQYAENNQFDKSQVLNEVPATTQAVEAYTDPAGDALPSLSPVTQSADVLVLYKVAVDQALAPTAQYIDGFVGQRMASAQTLRSATQEADGIVSPRIYGVSQTLPYATQEAIGTQIITAAVNNRLESATQHSMAYNMNIDAAVDQTLRAAEQDAGGWSGHKAYVTQLLALTTQVQQGDEGPIYTTAKVSPSSAAISQSLRNVTQAVEAFALYKIANNTVPALTSKYTRVRVINPVPITVSQRLAPARQWPRADSGSIRRPEIAQELRCATQAVRVNVKYRVYTLTVPMSPPPELNPFAHDTVSCETISHDVVEIEATV